MRKKYKYLGETMWSYDPDYEFQVGKSNIVLVGVFESKEEAEIYWYSDTFLYMTREPIYEFSKDPITQPSFV